MAKKLKEHLLVAALPRIACVLKPYPESVPPEEIKVAVEELVRAGLVHPGTSPNLTAKGLELARSLAEKA